METLNASHIYDAIWTNERFEDFHIIFIQALYIFSLDHLEL